MTIKKNLITCLACKGNKTQKVYEDGILIDTIDCPSCEGSGKMVTGWVETCEENIFESHVILECLDATEYNALTDGSKAALSLLLSCGMVNLNDDKLGKITLWTAFGAESTTVENLTALMA